MKERAPMWSGGGEQGERLLRADSNKEQSVTGNKQPGSTSGKNGLKKKKVQLIPQC